MKRAEAILAATRGAIAATIAGLALSASAGAAHGAATTYDLNLFLGQRDPVFDAFYGIAPPPPARATASAAAGTLYDMRIFLTQRDPVFDAFYGIPPVAPGQGR